MVQVSLNPNITFLAEKLWSVAWNQKGKKLKNAYKKRKMEISKIIFLNFVSHVKDHSTHKLAS